MKNSTIPAIRVTQALRDAAESVLEKGETLSGFVENSLRVRIEQRQAQKEFLQRGLASRDEARASGEYHAADDALKELDEILADVEAKVSK